MSIEILLSRLQKVRGRNGSWTACCPAHEDKTPSLAIRDDGGKIILHCFAGCQVNDIAAAVGMDMADLFPPKDEDYAPRPRVKVFASDLLKVLHLEAQIVRVAAYDLSKGRAISEPDRERLKLACDRIGEAVEMAHG